ncbi:putative Dolichyl-diphosphooligosaccharide--protein glycosyltransferase 48 kDa subunit [Blattamonas nauphoetae]|uniref:Dolichyl-diphosphooligosaccharide--protein glycosyltransferase 48 kDa subunit n=1 Tax=Blattamonas nauphoetae TaxID=2049346 RepID=A0ABQ9XWI3_9EUKA|nr:putative Dolichyl-diphosphooligosaccharide--protein glycosyltransferase 48 kDa subunit [Blattamonas nauphoetae]
MLSLFALIIASIHPFKVDIFGSLDEMSQFSDSIQALGIEIDEIDDLNSLLVNGEYTADGLIINQNFENNQLVLDYLNHGHSVIIILEEGAESSNNFLEEIDLTMDSQTEKSETCSFYSPTQDKTLDSLRCTGFKLDKDEDLKPHFFPIIRNSEGENYGVAIQGTNGARLVVFGAPALLYDNTFAKYPDNRQAARSLLSWVFGFTGKMRSRDFTFKNLRDGSVSPKEIRINDTIEVSIVFETFDIEEQKWVGWNADDVQLDVSMLTPRIRQTMTNKGNGLFETVVQVPDLFGVYTLVIDYEARGYTPLNITQQLMIRPFRHDEKARFLPSAYPFYTVVWCIMIVAILVMVIPAFTLSAPFFRRPLPKKEETKEK